MNKKQNKKNEIIKQAFQLIEKNGWKRFSIRKFSEEKKIELKKLEFLFNDKLDIIKDFSKMIDEEVVSEIDIEEFKNNSVKDNLFELVMLRFEKLEPYKQCLSNLVQEIKYEPRELQSILFSLIKSFDLFITISNGKSKDVYDFLKAPILFVIYFKSFQVWLNDSSKEMSSTMAEVDKWLSKSENLVEKLKSFI